MAKRLNVIERIQKWMDTMAGQTFMNYAYSWGAAIVILGTLFKLTHIQGANIMLLIGMGTEVFVFIIAGFERVTERVPDSEAASAGKKLSDEAIKGLASAASAAVKNGIGGVASDGPVIIQGNAPAGGAVSDSPVIIQGNIPSGGVVTIGGGAMPAEVADPATIEEAQKNYAERLDELTEVLGRVKVQAERMSTDSEEMENLNRTLTGIATVYELQLRNISKQVATIEQIDEQTRRMAQQIEELNNVYGRMIKALTVNMAAPAAQG